MERTGRAQAKLVDDLLEVSRIVTGRMRLDRRSLDLVPIMEAAIAALRPDAGSSAESAPFEASFLKNRLISIFAVVSIKRCPTEAILPPICASTLFGARSAARANDPYALAGSPDASYAFASL